LARGKLHLLAGAKGAGKTTIALAIAAPFTVGGQLPDGSQAPLGDVLMWSGEDDLADTLLPRLIACGGDPRRFHFVGGVTEKGKERSFDPGSDMPALIAAASALPELILINVDPIVSAVPGDSHKNTEVRRGLQPTVDLLRVTRAAGFGVTHYSKATKGQDPVDRINGSLAFGAIPRVIFGAAKPRDEATTKRRFIRVASNIGPDGGGFEYELEQQLLPDLAFTAQHVVWGAALAGDARTLLGEVEEDDSAEPTKIAEAGRWLRERLATGPVSSVELEADARTEGLSWRTIKRAKRANRIVVEKDGMAGPWRWRLPRQEVQK
jgi:putative DNA primase/helicase